MEDLQDKINALIEEHGQDAVWGAVVNGSGPCPKGYIRNGQGVCVPDIGN